MPDGVIDGTKDAFGRLWDKAPEAAVALLFVVAGILVGKLFGQMVARVLRTTRLSSIHYRFFRALSVWFFVLLGISAAMGVLGLDAVLGGFLAGSGVAAIILGFAFKEIGENLLAGLFLAFSRPFDVGDLILSDGLEGAVREIQLRFTHIRTADGRDIYIPNSQIFNQPLVNYTRDGLRRPGFTIGIDYEDDADAACQLMLAVVRAVPGVLAEPGPNAVICSFEPLYVQLEVTFWVNTFGNGSQATKLRGVQEAPLLQIRSNAMEACRRTLIEHGFTFSANVTTGIDLKRAAGLGSLPDGQGEPA